MKSSLDKFTLSASSPALVAAMLLFAPTAIAQTVEPGVESVTVTGTNIRGAAPVGSHVATLTQQDIEVIAPTSVTGVLASLPQLSTSGTAAQGENSYTFY